ncbi:MAG: hypothetical protein K2Q01_09610 [Rickettsiales bacterium]|nr:hypothetical protein [Rickettsiales bacterium]
MAYTAVKDEVSKTERPARNDNIGLDQDGLANMAHRAGQKLSSTLGTAYKEATHASEVVTREICNKPVQSAVIALGAGYILAALLRRR